MLKLFVPKRSDLTDRTHFLFCVYKRQIIAWTINTGTTYWPRKSMSNKQPGAVSLQQVYINSTLASYLDIHFWPLSRTNKKAAVIRTHIQAHFSYNRGTDNADGWLVCYFPNFSGLLKSVRYPTECQATAASAHLWGTCEPFFHTSQTCPQTITQMSIE